MASNHKKAIYYPLQDTEIIPYYDNAYNKLHDTLAAKYGIQPEEMAIIQSHNTNVPTVIEKAHADRAVSQESTTLKRVELGRAKKDIMRVFQKICNAENFEEADAEALGIRVHKTPPDYNSVVPVITDVTVLPDQVLFDWVKSFLDGVIIEGSYDNTNWTKIGTDTRSPFEDTRKNQKSDAPEIRYYRFRYFKHDVPVGLYTDVIKVNCDII